MVIDRDSLAERDIPYLGWFLEGAVSSFRHYAWYAREHQGDNRFSLVVGHPDYDAGKALGLGLARGKIFLGTWENLVEYNVRLPLPSSSLGTRQIGNALLKGLYSLYERPFPQGQFPIDMEGIALELGVQREVMVRSLQRLVDDGLVHNSRSMADSWPGAFIWLTSAGASFVEQNLLGLTDERGQEVMSQQAVASSASDPASGRSGSRKRWASPKSHL